MAASFFFYDLETSGFNPRSARVMQFAGQRTDLELKPVGEPVNVLIKLSPDTLPEPDAILVTGITPQQTLADGVTEAEFLKLFYDEVVQPNTIFAGFNSVRFDDEFVRFLNYRNFYDAYEWQWKDGCSRWDILDIVRMTRALRPEGIEWPFAPDGKPANRLEYLTKVNKLEHSNAHDALSDVMATIDVAKLVRGKQKDLFKYLLGLRDKKKVAELVLKGAPFVYTSGRYSSQYAHTTAAVLLDKHPQSDAALVYDLRVDPTPFMQMDVDQIVQAWRFTRDPDAVRLPVKTLKYNRCPAIAPLGVIKDQVVQERLQLPLETVTKHLKVLRQGQEAFANKIQAAVARLDEEREQTQTALVTDQLTVDGRLYDGFIDSADKTVMRALRAAKPEELGQFADEFHDGRLRDLLPLYKARNYPQSLTEEERASWDDFCRRKLFAGGNDSRITKYFARLEELAKTKLSGEKQYLLEELQLYGQSIVPYAADDDAAG
ncbi:MAG TPA: exodeoxyribonuclease I [Candidatus Dormibacteraeota bacterium]|nr:exodeoxyribonuclease I [Candidatus Dormibacteraeota bacterium]